MGSRDMVVDALLKQFGILRVNNLNEMFNTAKGFENFPIPKGNRVAVITNAGGPGILAVDNLELENLVLAVLSDKTKDKLNVIVHPEGSVENPVDLLPGATAENYKRVVEIVAADENVDAVINIFVEPVMVQPFDVVEAVSDVKSEKPILQADMPLPEFWDTYRKYSKKQLPIFKNPEDPAEVLSNMLFYENARNRLTKLKSEYNFNIASGVNKYGLSHGFISQDEINTIAEDYKLPIVKNMIFDPESVNQLTGEYFPIVLKGINRKVVHKSELNAVKLNIKNKEELLKAAEEIKANFTKYHFKVEEFLVQPYIKTKHEILIGGFRDHSFGPVIMFGSGGKYVEIICDTSIKSAYLTDYDIDDMINSTTIGKILHGVRGEEPVDILKLKRVIKSAAQMFIENDCIEEFDFNPLIISEHNVMYAVDIRIKAK
jgi:acetyltransferase